MFTRSNIVKAIIFFIVLALAVFCIVFYIDLLKLARLIIFNDFSSTIFDQEEDSALVDIIMTLKGR